jgi:hypothetical protein
MNPLVLGAGVAAVLAGPPLYALVQTGQMDGTNALLRGLLVAGVCALGIGYVLKIVAGYDEEWAKKNQRLDLLKAIEEAELAAKRHAEATAQSEEQKKNGASS